MEDYASSILNDSRLLPAFKKAMKLACEMTDISDAVRALAPFVGEPVTEERVPVKFNKNTGKPVRFEWKPTTMTFLHPARDWGRGRLFCTMDGTRRRACPFLKALGKRLQPGQLLVVPLDAQFFVIEYVSGGGKTFSYFRIRKSV